MGRRTDRGDRKNEESSWDWGGLLASSKISTQSSLRGSQSQKEGSQGTKKLGISFVCIGWA